MTCRTSLLYALLDNMGRNKPLKDYEKGQIDILLAQGWSVRAIAAQIKRSRSVVAGYKLDPVN